MITKWKKLYAYNRNEFRRRCDELYSYDTNKYTIDTMDLAGPIKRLLLRITLTHPLSPKNKYSCSLKDVAARMTPLADPPFSRKPRPTSADRHVSSAMAKTTASPIGKVSAKGVAVSKVATIMTAFTMMAEVAAMMAAVMTAALIIPGIA